MKAALFSFKCLLSAALAYYVALRVGLTNPYWSITSSYIVAAPLAGAVLSKATARVLGTTIGATFTVLAVPVFVDEPILLTGVLALWLGLCTYIAILDGTPRAYIFVLAGFTASIIGFPAVDAPRSVFDIASARFQEIIIGILCSSAVHALVLPTTVTSRLLAKVRTITAQAIGWSRKGLEVGADQSISAERLSLSRDLAEMETLAAHLPFDMAADSPRPSLLWALQERLIMALPLMATIEKRRHALQARLGKEPPDVTALLEETAQWMHADAGKECPGRRRSLLEAIGARQRALLTDHMSWPDLLQLNLLTRLAELIAVHSDIHLLRNAILSGDRRRRPEVRAIVRSARARSNHADHALALRASVGSMVAVALACGFWIAAGWQDGANAAVFVGICCSLFGNVPNPTPVVVNFLVGSALGMMTAMLWAFAIVPTVTDYVSLIAVIAPALFVMGLLLSHPSRLVFANGIILGFCNNVGLASRYSVQFDRFANACTAQLIGIGFAALSVRLFQTVGADTVARTLIRSCRREVMARARGREADTPRYMSRMIDRVGHLLSIANRPAGDAASLDEALVDTRIGYVAGELSRTRFHTGPRSAAAIAVCLEGVAHHFESTGGLEPAGERLIADLDRALALVIARSRQRGADEQLVLLTSLRCDLSLDPIIARENPASAIVVR